ncbi:MAG: hypothetical protein ACRETB_03460, partial [Steroidobacteraceae bacterium]
PLEALACAPDRTLRLAAVAALAQIPAATTEGLLRFVGNEAAAIRRRAVAALRERRSLDPERAALLLGDPDRAVRRLAQAVLDESGAAATAPIGRLLLALGSPTRGLERRAVLCWRLLGWLCRERIRRRRRRAH